MSTRNQIVHYEAFKGVTVRAENNVALPAPVSMLGRDVPYSWYPAGILDATYHVPEATTQGSRPTQQLEHNLDWSFCRSFLLLCHN